jgi:hypothetical protein
MSSCARLSGFNGGHQLLYFFDAHCLPGKDVAEIDSFLAQTVSAAAIRVLKAPVSYSITCSMVTRTVAGTSIRAQP